MQRIYGVVFPTQEELLEYEKFLKEAKNRDHRKIGQDLDLFSIQNEIGAGLVLWHPKGSVIRLKLKNIGEKNTSNMGMIYSIHLILPGWIYGIPVATPISTLKICFLPSNLIIPDIS